MANKNRGKGSRNQNNQRNGRKSAQNQKGFKDYEESVAPSDHDSSNIPKDKAGRHGVNDKGWWTRNGQILKDSATIPQMNPIGGTLDLLDTNVEGTSNYSQTLFSKYFVPGICAIECYHGPGIAYEKNDAVNQAFLSQMEYVRAQITPNIDYDYADQGMIEIAMGDAYVWWANMVRVYGVVRQYVFENQYFPRIMTEALGFDFDQIRNNLTDFRMLINQMALALGAFPVPELDYYKRLLAVYGNLFVDSNSSKAQVYALVPGVLRTYDPTDDVGTTLEPTIDLRKYYRTKEKISYSTARNITWSIIDAIRNDDDVYKIFGNIKNPNTWGNRVFSISQIPEDYIIQPVPDRDFLHMIMNGTCWYDVDLSSLRVTQNPSVQDGRILYRPKVQFRAAVDPSQDYFDAWEDFSTMLAAGPRVINAYDSDYIDASDVIYWSRFTSAITRSGVASQDQFTIGDGVITAPITTGGIELLGRCHVYTYAYSPESPSEKIVRNTTITYQNIDGGETFNNIERAAYIAAFNFHPTVWLMHQQDNAEYPDVGSKRVYNNIHVVQQWETVAVISNSQLENIQWGAVYSLWGIDSSSNYSG